MKFFSDWVALSLAIGLLCGGCAAGKRVGAFAAVWLAGAAWFALRMADALWEPAARELARLAENIGTAEALPTAYGLLFVCALLPSVALLLLLRPTGNVELPTRAESGVSILAGMVVGALVLGAVLQSQIQEPVAHEAMPRTMAWTQSVLKSMGQTHVAAQPLPADPAEEDAGELP